MSSSKEYTRDQDCPSIGGRQCPYGKQKGSTPLDRPEPLNWDNNWEGTKEKGARALFGRKLQYHSIGMVVLTN